MHWPSSPRDRYRDAQGPVRFNVFNKQMVIVAEPAHLRSVWHSNLKAYSKVGHSLPVWLWNKDPKRC